MYGWLLAEWIRCELCRLACRSVWRLTVFCGRGGAAGRRQLLSVLPAAVAVAAATALAAAALTLAAVTIAAAALAQPAALVAAFTDTAAKPAAGARLRSQPVRGWLLADQSWL